MTHSPSHLPRISSIPLTNPADLVQAWEWFELSEQRVALTAIQGMNQSPNYSLLAQLDAFVRWQHQARMKLRDYRASVARQVEAQGQSMPADLDELPAIVAACGNTPVLLCHLGVLKAYLGLSTCVLASASRSERPEKNIDETLDDLLSLEYSLFCLQWTAGKRAAEKYRKAGYPVDDWFVVSNPFGIQGSGPCWLIDPEVDPEDVLWPVPASAKAH